MAMIPTAISEFNGGIINDPRDTSGNTARVVSNFDILTDTHRLVPYRSSENGDGSAATSQKQNFCIANWLPGSTNDWRLFALGVVSGTGRAEILMKTLGTGGSTDLRDSGWATPANNASAAGSTSFGLFVFYKKTGFIYGAKSGTTVWAFDPTASAAFDDAQHTLAGAGTAQGVVHSKDDILYVPYGSSIAKNNNGSWTDAALVLPSHLTITSICEYGDFLAIAAAPVSGLGNSRVYLWDRDSSLTTVTVSADGGTGNIRVLEEVDGALIGISLATTRFKERVIFRQLSVDKMVKFKEITGTTGTLLPFYKQKIDNRVYFQMSVTLGGAVREGIWSIGRSTPSAPFALIHERTPNNDTALSSGSLTGFFYVGDYCFQSYQSSGAFGLSKTNDVSTYAASGIYETVIFNAVLGLRNRHIPDSSQYKDFVGASVTTEPLPSGGQVLVKYKVDTDSVWSSAFITHTTTNGIHKSAIQPSAKIPQHKEIQFRLESTGGAVITGFKFHQEITGKDLY